MNHLKPSILIILSLFCFGCHSDTYRPITCDTESDSDTCRSIACDIESDQRIGRGVIIGPDTVLTVIHVIEKTTHLKVDGHPATIIETKITADNDAVTNDDGLAVLKVETTFSSDQIAKFSDKARGPLSYLSRHGKEIWPWKLNCGDSGSPIINSKNEVVGVVRAVRGIYVPMTKPKENCGPILEKLLKSTSSF